MRLRDLIREEIQAASSPWRDREGAMRYLNCSSATLSRLCAQGKVKAHWLGASPRFRTADLDRCISKQKTK